MRSFVALRTDGFARCAPILERLRSREHRPPATMAVLLCTLAVAGCAQAYTKTTVVVPYRSRSTAAIPVHHPPPRHIATPEPSPTGVMRPAKKAIPVPDPELLRAPPAKKAIPLPESELLEPPSEPNCDYEIGADDRQKLDYERQCYRHAESIMRARLQRLQKELEETLKAVKGDD